MVCFNCNQTGHIARNCTHPRRPDLAGSTPSQQPMAPSWKKTPPAPGAPSTVSRNGKTWHWCAHCNRWSTSHGTATHTGPIPPRRPRATPPSGAPPAASTPAPAPAPAPPLAPGSTANLAGLEDLDDPAAWHAPHAPHRSPFLVGPFVLLSLLLWSWVVSSSLWVLSHPDLVWLPSLWSLIHHTYLWISGRLPAPLASVWISSTLPPSFPTPWLSSSAFSDLDPLLWIRPLSWFCAFLTGCLLCRSPRPCCSGPCYRPDCFHARQRIRAATLRRRLLPLHRLLRSLLALASSLFFLLLLPPIWLFRSFFGLCHMPCPCCRPFRKGDFSERPKNRKRHHQKRNRRTHSCRPEPHSPNRWEYTHRDWTKAMEKELKELQQRGVFNAASSPPPSGPSQWTYHPKTDPPSVQPFAFHTDGHELWETFQRRFPMCFKPRTYEQLVQFSVHGCGAGTCPRCSKHFQQQEAPSPSPDVPEPAVSPTIQPASRAICHSCEPWMSHDPLLCQHGQKCKYPEDCPYLEKPSRSPSSVLPTVPPPLEDDDSSWDGFRPARPAHQTMTLILMMRTSLTGLDYDLHQTMTLTQMMKTTCPLSSVIYPPTFQAWSLEPIHCQMMMTRC